MEKTDPDKLVDRVAKAILSTRAPGLGKQQWAKRAAAAAVELVTDELALQAPVAKPLTPEMFTVKPRFCGGWIGLFNDGSLKFGVTADSEAETRAALDATLVLWRRDLASPARTPEAS